MDIDRRLDVTALDNELRWCLPLLGGAAIIIVKKPWISLHFTYVLSTRTRTVSKLI